MKQQILKITENIRVAENVYKMVLEDPELEEMKPGQFVNIRLDGLYLRRPISVCESEAGSLTIIYKVVGKGTEQMSRMKEREKLDVLTGLGNGYDLSKAGDRPLLLGGGVGVPPLVMLARKLREQGKDVTAVLGFNTMEEVFGQAAFEIMGVNTIVTTADGTFGTKGFVTDARPPDSSALRNGWGAASAPAWAAAVKRSRETSASAGKARCWRRRRSCLGQTDNIPVRHRTGQSGDPRQRHLRIRI